MLTPELLDTIEHMARILRKNSKPFGGIQVVFCGDWFQLQPVLNHEREPQYEKMDFCFETESWKTLIKSENVVILKENYRQKSDPQFQKCLDEIREGAVSQETIELLKSRVGAVLDLPEGIKATHLYPYIKQVDLENTKELAKLDSKSITYTYKSEPSGISESTEHYMIKVHSR